MSVVSWEYSWDKERFNRESINPNQICTFGIKLLDDVLYGILKKDFIVIGADSGAGKSELCLKIAVHNALNGKKVILYFIEGGDEEAIARIKWEMIRDKYYSGNHSGVDMDYRKWRMNMLNDPLIKVLETECKAIFKEKVQKNLTIYENPKGLTLKDFMESVDIFLDADLIIIDHLQYFTLSNPKNELTEQTEILKKVNEICHSSAIPVILVSHLRKKDKERGLPSQEDFYGTSNIAKMSSLAITISSDYSDDGTKFPTYFRFVKTRTKISANFALRSDFNLLSGKYENDYFAYSVIGDRLADNPLTIDKLPKFARGAKGYAPIIKKTQYTD